MLHQNMFNKLGHNDKEIRNKNALYQQYIILLSTLFNIFMINFFPSLTIGVD